ncbi:protein MAIN-LIKE 1-like isoform X2 [Prosopis cineraria]|uniref:protein MAIN-LIKE 1-like isoform X2 n=1 Tax=Prosopis cineraria TaxID=364024 RepID=UPI0024101DF8|nr:protein MAIN-LIKE 1-like isoform X2 [Prosopis cineraria]
MRRSTRRSLITPAEVEEPARNISTRFSLKSYVKRVQLLTDDQRLAITKMGFGSVLLFPNHLLSKNLLAELMERWDCEKQAFIFHLGEISMTLLDVALILGLRVVGRPVLLKDDEPFSDLEEEYGATTSNRKVTVASLESRLDSLEDSAGDDFIRAFLLYTFGTLLFQSSNGKVDSRYLSLLRKLDEVRQFAWGAAVIEDLSKWLDKRKENNVQYVGGCLMFLQTWSYEHFDIGRPGMQEHDFAFPRLCRWHNNKSNQRQWFASKFKDLQDDQVIWTLQPTSRELELDIIKEALELQDDTKRLGSGPDCPTSTPISVPDVDSGLQHSASKSQELQKEQEVNFENQIVEDTTTELSPCDRVHRDVNVENLIVADTPTKLSTCDRVHRDVNVENLIVEDTPTKSSTCDEVDREFVNLAEEDSPTENVCDQVCREQEVNLEKLIVEDTPTRMI